MQTHECDQCSRKYKTEKGLLKHKESHNSIKVQCTHEGCSRFFANQEKLDGHIKRKHDPNLLSCPLCDKKLSNKRLLDSHMLVHDPDRRLYMCTEQGCYIFRTKLDLMQVHISSAHEKQIDSDLIPSVPFPEKASLKIVKAKLKIEKMQKNIPDEQLPLQEGKECCICMEQNADTAVVPCGHLLFCFTCICSYVDTNKEKGCPVCRGEIKSYLRIYS